MDFVLALDLEGEAFCLAGYLTLGLDLVGRASSAVGSTETEAGCVGLNTTAVLIWCFKKGDTEGMRANILFGSHLTGPKDYWSEIL